MTIFGLGGSKRRRNFFVNTFLLATGGAMIVSGLVLQIGYHIGRHSATFPVWGIVQEDWRRLHIWSAVGFTLLIAVHIQGYWKWYKGVFTRRLFRQHKQPLFLTLLLLMVTLTGFVPWLLGAFCDGEAARHLWVEIHDKIAILFAIFLVGHVAKRAKRYINTIR